MSFQQIAYRFGLPKNAVSKPEGVTSNAKEVLREIVRFRVQNRQLLNSHHLAIMRKWTNDLKKLIRSGEKNGHFSCCPLADWFPGANLDVTDSCKCCIIAFIELRLEAWQQNLIPADQPSLLYCCVNSNQT